MRYIEIPKPFTLDNVELGAGKKNPQVTFHEFLRDWLVTQDNVNKNPAMYHDLVMQTKTMKPGDTWEMESEEWEFLAEIARKQQFNGNVKFYTLLHVAAITDAPNKDPRKKTDEEKPKDEEASKN